MAFPPDIKRIVREDFAEEDQAIIDKLAFSLNPFMEQVVNALTRSIDFQNLAQELKIIENVNVNPTTGIPIRQIQFATTLTKPLQGMTCIRAINRSRTDTYPTGGIFASFFSDGKIVTITHITGLPASAGDPNVSDTFRLSFHVIT